MSFGKKFGTVAPVLLALPFIFILLFMKGGAEDCLDNIEKGLPDAITGDATALDEATDKYCDPEKGKFHYGQKLADITVDFYSVYMWFALILSLIIAGIWEVKG